jgi:uncharacterized protein (DUF302 family)
VSRPIWLAAVFFVVKGVVGVASAADPPVLSAESPYDTATTLAQVKAAIGAHQYQIIRIQNAYEGLRNNEAGPVIVYFCNFGFLHSALQQSRNVGPLLPCHVVISSEHGRVKVYAPNPKVLAAPFVGRDQALQKLCDQVTQDYRDILDEGTM